MSEDKAKIANKIRALLAKTSDNGCTEAEAMAAAVKAKALMDEYQINLSEYELEQEGFVKGKAEKPKPFRFSIQGTLAFAVSEFCDCKVWCTFDKSSYQKRSDKRMVFFGLRSDVEFANWLLVALESFIFVQAQEFETKLRMSNGPDAGGYYVKRNFAMGACSRINERLREAIKAKNPVHMADGRALMVVKNQLVNAEFKKLGLHIGKGSSSSYKRGDAPPDAYAAGRAAGDKASFARPVHTKETLKLS